MTAVTSVAQNVQKKAAENSTLQLVREWDKTFPKSDKVRHEKVTFRNRFGTTLAADLYIPKDAKAKMAAIAVSGPFGAVKEQASGLYAQHLAEEGEVGGKPFALTAKDMKQIRKLNKEQRFFNRRTSERRAELAPAIPSEEEEDEVNATYEQAKGYVNFPIMDAQERAEAELSTLSAQKWQWMAEKNVTELAKLFHKDAMFVHMGGAWGRTAELKAIERGFIWYKHADVHRVESRISGSTAVVYSDIQLTSEVGGREVSFPFFVSEVYTKEGETWKLVTLAFTKKDLLSRVSRAHRMK